VKENSCYPSAVHTSRREESGGRALRTWSCGRKKKEKKKDPGAVLLSQKKKEVESLSALVRQEGKEGWTLPRSSDRKKGIPAVRST